MHESTKYIKFCFVFLLTHFLSFYFKILPLGLIYGPLIYAIAYGIPIKTFISHLIIPVLFFCYGLLIALRVFNWDNSLPLSFVSVYYLLISISMVGYYLVVFFRKSQQRTHYSKIKKELLHLLKFFYVMGCLFTIVLFFNSMGIIKNWGFNCQYLINLLIGSAIFVVVYYLFENHKEIKNLNRTFPYIVENSKMMEELEEKLTIFFQETQLFLKSDITLEMLSEESKIPKHHLTRLFNLHMSKNFYLVIGEYRIQYAKKRLEEDNNLTIESLSFECGFSSKSTFNKYFKEQIGSSPSEYRLNFS
ncbi:AraC family transcriptional regulator [Flavobacterium sp. PL002]|uniref:helix-turn-helix domain-containing protein n=1 Tax=Flavobacterium sp. PL002 TaxID=1897058 RepID=UPI0017887D20|nr:helix-turn-helix transcriptional regulator [Flavobacterium sp. PL002]MBE0393425.1 HTH-type transcriptional regulator CdhR [Flavobacterium sp. PL002]